MKLLFLSLKEKPGSAINERTPLHEFREIIDRLEAVYMEFEIEHKNREEHDRIKGLRQRKF